MVHHVTRFSDAYSAWENWNLTDFNSRCECLLAFKNALVESSNIAASVANYHIEHAASLLADSHQLVGPTGETNELYTAGRGVALIIQDDHSETAQLAVIAQVTTALIAGNGVILCSDDTALATMLEKAFVQSTIPTNLIQFASNDAYQQLLESDIRVLGYVGTPKVEAQLNRQLAKRHGAIVSLVSETDTINTPVALDPHLSLRFITERTRTINITAVGGNTTLLELGSEAH